MKLNFAAVRKALVRPVAVPALVAGVLLAGAILFGFGSGPATSNSWTPVATHPELRRPGAVNYPAPPVVPGYRLLPFPMPNQYYKDTDEFYVFQSGGQQCGIIVYGIPSGKYLAEIPIFCEAENWGWTLDNPEVKKMMTNPYTGEIVTRGDTHHPSLSRTNAIYDGRWLFIGDKIYGRVARMDLATFRTKQILWYPNTFGGWHGNMLGPNSHHWVQNIEHEQIPDKVIVDHLGLKVDPINGPWLGGLTGVKIDDKGLMKNAWQVWGPWHQDLGGRIGWGVSKGWVVSPTYNTERALHTLEMFRNKEDYLFMWNIPSIEKAVAEGKYVTTKSAPDVPVVAWKDVEVYVTPVPLNPHGVDISPTGKYFVVAGKATTLNSVTNFEKALQMIKQKKFCGETYGVKILCEKDVREATIDEGLGATHNEFDNEGFYWTSYFIDADLKRVPMGAPYDKIWRKKYPNLKPWVVADVVPTHYSVGHMMIPGGDSAKPYGKYAIAMNKLTKDVWLNHGPLHNETHELFDISQIPSRMIDQISTMPEPHYAQAMPVSMLHDKIKVAYELPKNVPELGIKYDYANKTVTFSTSVVRSFYTPDTFTVPQGWKVKALLQNNEEEEDMTHGFVVDGYNISESIDPGEFKEVDFVADKAGQHWFYCIWFCSELHMEMRGVMIVIPQDQWTSKMESHYTPTT